MTATKLSMVICLYFGHTTEYIWQIIFLFKNNVYFIVPGYKTFRFNGAHGLIFILKQTDVVTASQNYSLHTIAFQTIFDL